MSNITDEVTCLCLFDKILAARGNVHVLVYSGNEVCDCAQSMTSEKQHTAMHGVMAVCLHTTVP